MFCNDIQLSIGSNMLKRLTISSSFFNEIISNTKYIVNNIINNQIVPNITENSFTR